MADDASPNTVISARPTIRVDDTAYPLLSANIVRMLMREAVGGLSSLELTVTDWLSQPDGSAGYGATSGSPLKLGAKVKIYAGPTMTPTNIFDGLITGIEAEAGTEGPPTFTILAEDALWKARKKRRSRTLEDKSPADIVRQVAQDHGFTPEVRDGLDSPTRTWVQMNESDLAFLRRVLSVVDGDAQAVGDKLQAGPLARDQRTAVTLTLGSSLVKVRASADMADQASEVRVGSFDPASGEAVVGSASDGELGPGQGPDGKSAVSNAVSQAREHIGHERPMAHAEADKLARAVFGRRARRFVRVEAIAQGDPSIRVGSWVTLKGINPLFANDYVVTEAVHRFDPAGGYLTELSAEGAHLGTPA